MVMMTSHAPHKAAGDVATFAPRLASGCALAEFLLQISVPDGDLVAASYKALRDCRPHFSRPTTDFPSHYGHHRSDERSEPYDICTGITSGQ
jgi:hypothetical protein